MTLEEFEAGTPLTPEECSEIQSAADALLEAIADIQLEHGEDATNAAFSQLLTHGTKTPARL